MSSPDHSSPQISDHTMMLGCIMPNDSIPKDTRLMKCAADVLIINCVVLRDNDGCRNDAKGNVVATERITGYNTTMVKLPKQKRGKQSSSTATSGGVKRSELCKKRSRKPKDVVSVSIPKGKCSQKGVNKKKKP